ncbi:MAG: TIGR01458 family HAD-type hydrolase [Rhodobacteraceae bacterium]|nr:TIGR01458 family HAD-type hydrolase [Paracoccaceae bacterium]
MIKGVLLDLSGVLYVGSTALPGAVEAVARLRGELPVRFVTNSTRNPKRVLLEKLSGLGFSLTEDELFTPAKAACDWLAANNHSPHLLIYPDLQEDFATCSTNSPPAIVLGDAGKFFTFDALNTAFRILHNGAPFLALAANRTFKDDDNEISIDAGAFVAALEYSSGTNAKVMGKPAPAFFTAAASDMGCTLDETAMIGDDAEADVAGALQSGISTALLVRTGKYTAGDETRYKPNPTATMNHIAAAVDWVLAQKTA